MHFKRDFLTGAMAAVLLLAAASAAYAYALAERAASHSATEAGFDEPDDGQDEHTDPYADWTRPDVPIRVGLQAGHWLAKEAPDELANIRGNGAYAAGINEWEANLAIAEATRRLLEPHGILVDILPATIPPDYWADAFVSIHADDNDDIRVSGYKVAFPRRDRTGRAAELAQLLESKYGEVTGLALDPNVTSNMRGYYAFNWRRYEHSIHPMTAAAIIETGFLSNPADRRVFVRQPDLAAQGIARAILEFLRLNEVPAL